MNISNQALRIATLKIQHFDASKPYFFLVLNPKNQCRIEICCRKTSYLLQNFVLHLALYPKIFSEETFLQHHFVAGEGACLIGKKK